MNLVNAFKLNPSGGENATGGVMGLCGDGFVWYGGG